MQSYCSTVYFLLWGLRCMFTVFPWIILFLGETRVVSPAVSAGSIQMALQLQSKHCNCHWHITLCSCRASEHRKHWAAENLPNSCHVVCSSLGTVWCRHKWDDLSPSHRDKLAIVCQSHSKVGVCRLWAVSVNRLWAHTHTVHWSYRPSQDISWILLMDIWPLQ